jgi:hypothetical protein
MKIGSGAKITTAGDSVVLALLSSGVWEVHTQVAPIVDSDWTNYVESSPLRRG